MMNTLRESAHGIFAKILLGMLVLSFGIWGIGDIFRGGNGASNVATVGDNVISLPEYQYELRNRQEMLRQRLGAQYNADLFRQLGLPLMVREEMINKLLILNEVKRLGIELSDQDIATIISKNPGFLDKDGNFDKSIYQGALKSHNMSEQRYVKNLRSDWGAKLLVESLTNSVTAPGVLAQALYRIQEEKREIGLMTLPLSSVKDSAAPKEEAIKAYYDAHVKFFMHPEYRDISYVEIKPSVIENSIIVSDDDVKTVFEDKKAELHQPEKREVSQLLFASEKDAGVAFEKINKGMHFDEAAKTFPIVNKGKTALGKVAFSTLPEENAKVIFALKENQNSTPFHSDFGWHIFNVTKIIPEKETSLEEVKPEIIKELKLTRMQEAAAKLTNQLSDTLASGSTFEEAVAKIGQKAVIIKQVDQQGKTTDGKAVSLPALDNLLTTAFKLSEHQGSEAQQASDGTYFVVWVEHIKPATPQSFAEVKDKISNVLKQEAALKQLQQHAEELATQLRSDKPPANIPALVNIGTVKRGDIKGESAKTKLPYPLAEEIFRIPSGTYSKAYKSLDGSTYVIGFVKKIIPASNKYDEKALQKITQELKGSLTNEVMETYLQYLRNKYHVVVNDALLDNLASERAESAE